MCPANFTSYPIRARPGSVGAYNPYASYDILSDLERRFPMEFANNPALAFYNAIKP